MIPYAVPHGSNDVGILEISGALIISGILHVLVPAAVGIWALTEPDEEFVPIISLEVGHFVPHGEVPDTVEGAELPDQEQQLTEEPAPVRPVEPPADPQVAAPVQPPPPVTDVPDSPQPRAEINPPPVPDTLRPPAPDEIPQDQVVVQTPEMVRVASVPVAEPQPDTESVLDPPVLPTPPPVSSQLIAVTEVPQAVTPDTETPLLAPVRAPSVVPVPNQEIAAAEPIPDPDAVVEAAPPAAAAPRAPPPRQESASAIAARQAGVPEDYYRRLRGKISEIAGQSYPPASLRRGEEGEVLMIIRLREDGTVMDISVDESATDAPLRLQRAAQRAVLRAAPFEPLPRGAGVKTIRLPVKYLIE